MREAHPMLWTLLLACSPAPAPVVAPPVAIVRAVTGPWEAGDFPAIAADGDAVGAVWLEGTTLKWAASSDRGATWGPAEAVATDVIAGDGGQALPVLAMAGEVPIVAYAAADRPWLATRGHEGWQATKLSSAATGMGVLLDFVLIDGQPLVGWLDTRRGPEAHTTDVYAWWGGQEQAVLVDGGDGVCMCCRPAVGSVGGLPAVAFRDAEGALRETMTAVREASGWVVRSGTTGGWSPGGCPADGPVLDGDSAWVSDGRDGKRRVYKGDVAVSSGREALQPRVIDGRALWVEVGDGEPTLVAEGAVLATSTRLEPGDPARVGAEIWVPWQGERGHVVAWSPAE